MANNSAEELAKDWVFYKDREEWKDVEPLPQDDGENPVVAIAYSDKFKDVHEYFRAVLKSEEKSERVLELTKDALKLNPANYTVWQHRRVVLKALDKDLAEEMEFVKKMIFDNPKNYQVWHHRRIIVEWLQSGEPEVTFTEEVLKLDAKNYHAWQHRQWVLKTFKLFDKELEYIDQLLKNDIRNNSAWNQRYFVLNNTSGFTNEVINREVLYTLEKIKLVTENESAWNYLRALLVQHEKSEVSGLEIVKTFCEELYAGGNRSPFMLALLVDMCEEQCKKLGPQGDGTYTLDRAKHLCDLLSKEYDTIRAKYWDNIAANIEHCCRENTSET